MRTKQRKIQVAMNKGIEDLKMNTEVKLRGVRLSTSFGGIHVQADIENIEVSGICDNVIKTLDLFEPKTTLQTHKPNKLPAIGSIYDGDIVGAHMVDDGEVYALLVAGKEAERELDWSRDLNDTDATSYSDGVANTKHLHSRSGVYPAARYCAIYKNSRYHLPSRLELSLITANSEAVTAAELDGWYWTSTQHSPYYAWKQHLSSGNQDSNGKTKTHKVRPVRRVKI